MKIVMAGPGAIGCFFGARLGRAGRTVWMLDHDAARAARLSASGIRLEWGGRTEVVSVRATCDPRAVGIADALFVCVKAHQTAAAMERAAECAGSQTVVVSLQNGLGNDEEIARRVAARQVVSAVTALGATLEAEGHVRDTGAGRTRVAPFVPEARWAADTAAAVLAQAGFDVDVSDDVRSLRWSKLVVNAAINPVTALWNVSNGAVIERSDLFAVAAEACREAARVAAAMGVCLPYADAVAELRAVCAATRSNVSSMCQDVRRGRRTEVEAINGAVIRCARPHGVATPVNETLAARVRGLEKGFEA
jgi:2-dehydropantoate 2-reductase